MCIIYIVPPPPKKTSTFLFFEYLWSGVLESERCKLPQWGLGRSPSRQTICCTVKSKSAALVAAVFVDFPKNKCIFCTNKLVIARRVQFLTERLPARSFSPRAVATIVLWKSAPMQSFAAHLQYDYLKCAMCINLAIRLAAPMRTALCRPLMYKC